MKRLSVFLFVVVTTSAEISDDFIRNNGRFSASLCKSFAQSTPGNFILSPFSTEVLLSLTESGCKDATAKQIRNTLYPRGSSTLNSLFDNVLSSLSTENSDYIINLANKIYVQNDFPVRDIFRRTARDIYKADCENIDFSERYEAAETMNNWIQIKTNNKIQNLIQAANLDDGSRVILLNALYFKAKWLKSFPGAYTKKQKFHLSQTSVIEVDTMRQYEKQFDYFESSNIRAKFLEIPFQGEEASMVIVLPDEIDGLRSIETQLIRILNLKPRKFKKRLVTLTLPKFKIESSVDLVPILKNVGITKIFDRENSDMSGIAGQKGELFVDKIVQKAFIDVSEEGVEAAAANYHLVAIPMSAPSEEPVKFKVDRPFIFYIKVKGIVIFVGRVVDPRLSM